MAIVILFCQFSMVTQRNHFFYYLDNCKSYFKKLNLKTMLENLLNLVKEFAGDAVVKNPDVPNEHNDAVTAEATKTVASGLQNMMAGGGLENVLSLFGGGGGQQQSGGGGLLKNPIVNMMIGHFSSKLMAKFGLGSSQANGVANNLIPNVISGLINRTNDPNNSSFDINSIIGSLTGGGAAAPAQQTAGGGGGFDFQNILSSFTGGGSGGGGGLADIISKVTGGAQQQQQQQGGGGGLLDMIKGFMK
jgi:hypothetical protein